MSVRQAIAEDLCRLGLILLAAGVVGGFLNDQIAHGPAIYATLAGVLFSVFGYWQHGKEENQ